MTTDSEIVATPRLISYTPQPAAAAAMPLIPSMRHLSADSERELKFLSFLSHDLQNNLAAIDLQLKLLERQLAASPGFGDQMQTLQRAQESIHGTIDGMRRLLTHERLRKQFQAAKIRPVYLRRIADAIAAQHSLQAAASGTSIAVDISVDALAHTDAELIVLVLQNLVGNGVKYSTSGVVRIIADDSGSCGGRWTLSVIDQGRGIPPRLLKEIFSAFQRGDSSDCEGMGLGLAIASQAAELLGAELSVESTLGVGSAFRLSLPPACR
jgi:signal transduction histidine kinase